MGAGGRLRETEVENNHPSGEYSSICLCFHVSIVGMEKCVTLALFNKGTIWHSGWSVGERLIKDKQGG